MLLNFNLCFGDFLYILTTAYSVRCIWYHEVWLPGGKHCLEYMTNSKEFFTPVFVHENWPEVTQKTKTHGYRDPKVLEDSTFKLLDKGRWFLYLIQESRIKTFRIQATDIVMGLYIDNFIEMVKSYRNIFSFKRSKLKNNFRWW